MEKGKNKKLAKITGWVYQKLFKINDTPQKRALGLFREAKQRVVEEEYRQYFDYVKNFAETKLKKSNGEAESLSADEIRTIDFLMVPRAKRMMKIWGLVNLAYISGIAACAILVSPSFLWLLLGLVLNGSVIDETPDHMRNFLTKRRRALKYLKEKEAKENARQIEKNEIKAGG